MNFRYFYIPIFILFLLSCKGRKGVLLEKNYLTENELIEVEKLVSEESIKNDTLFLDLVFGDAEKNVIQKLENHVKVKDLYKSTFFSNNSYMLPFKSFEGNYKCAISYQIIDSALAGVVLYFEFENDATMADLRKYVRNSDLNSIATKYKYNLNKDDYKFYLTRIYENSFNILDAYIKKYGEPLDVGKNIDISKLQNGDNSTWQNLESEILINNQNIYKKIWIQNNLEVAFTCGLYHSDYFVKVEYKFIPNIVKSKNKEKYDLEYNEKIEKQKIIQEKERQDSAIRKNKI